MKTKKTIIRLKTASVLPFSHPCWSDENIPEVFQIFNKNNKTIWLNGHWKAESISRFVEKYKAKHVSYQNAHVEIEYKSYCQF